MKNQIQISNILKTITFSILTYLAFMSNALGQQNVNVNVMVMQPMSPYLPQLVNEIQQGQLGTNGSTLKDKIIINLHNLSPEQRQIKLSAKLERLSPTYGSISLNPNYQPSNPILMAPNQVIRVDRAMVDAAFGGFSKKELIFDNMDYKSLKQNALNYKLPEGMYRLCVTAYDFNDLGQTIPMGYGCATFNICYSASAPQFTMPFSSIMMQGRDFETLAPMSNQIQFAWMAPTTTCGFPLGFITYEFEIRELYPGQTINDARNNVYVFRKENIPTNLFILDTLLYRNVLKSGKSYIAKVKANTQYNPNNPLEISNQGYSEIIAFKYQPKTNSNPPIIYSGGTRPSVFVNPQNPTITTPPTGFPGVNIPTLPGGITIIDPPLPPIPTPTVMSGDIPDLPIDCGLPTVDNSTTFTGTLSNGDIIKIGEFEMKVLNATKSENSFKGTGEITWSPYSRPIMMNVKYDNITLNSKKEVISGKIITTSAIEDINMINVSVPEFLNQVGNLKDKADAIVSKANSALKPLNQLTGNSPVDFPLGLDNKNIAGVKSTLAIMGIIFTPKGADARILFTMKIPEAGDGNEWLSLAGAGFCIHPNTFSVADGILYLPNDRSIDMGGGVAFKLRGGFLGDSSNTSYVKWNSTDGFERVYIKASVTLPKDVKPVDSLGNEIGGQVSLDTRFDFKEWEKWIANLNTDSRFSIEGLPGFVINPKAGIFYDHSIEANPNNLTWPTDADDIKFKGKEGNTYKGFYMKGLEMNLPKDFAGSSTTTLPTILIENLFINSENGLWADISANKLLDFGKGDLGGWLFSIDKINIPIKKWIPRGAAMSGVVALPISDDTLSYSCGLNTVDGHINYNFNISTVGNYKIPMWIADATLGAGTSIQIVKEKDAKLKVGADLNLLLSIDISNKPKVILNAVDIQGMQIANYNMKESNISKQKIGEFYFYSGDIKFATLSRSGGQSNSTGMLFPEDENNDLLYARGPYPGPDGNSSEGSASKDNTVCGFGFEPKNFSPKISTKDGHFAVGLEFGVGLRLGTDAIQLNGETSFTVWGVMGGTALKPTAKDSYPTVELNKVSIDGNFGEAISAKATLEFKNDDEWGQGVIGEGDVTFPMGIEISATVVFGSKSDYKYFGFGASLYMQSGIIPIGPLVINGFGGGYYQNLYLIAGDTNNWDRPFSFKPKKGTMAFNVSLDLTYIRAEMVKANAGFTLQLNSSGGFDKIMINGWANVISDGKQKSQGIVNAKLALEFAQDRFDMYVGANVKMFIANADIPIWVHIDKDKEDYQYWLYLGYPAKQESSEGAMGEAYRRITLTFIDINTSVLKVYLKASAYFCAGTKLPQFPPLPNEVNEFLGDKSSSMSKMLSDIGGGQSGFMFGAAVDGGLKLQLGIFYARASAKIGFDVAFRYFTKSPCGGAVDLKEKKDYPTDFGMNGWYANGQIYAFFTMDVGFILDLWFWSGEVSLVKLAIGAALEAGLPNPTWMDGRIRIQGEVLNGLIRVNTSARFSLGTKCSVGDDPLENIQMISEFGPAEKDVSIFANPYATFSIPMSNNNLYDPIEVEFQVPKTDSKGKEVLDDNDMPVIISRIYKFEVVDAKILKFATNDKSSSSSAVSNIELQYSENGYAASFINKGLNAFDELRLYGAYIKGRAFEKIGDKWKNPKEHPQGFTQDSTIYFNTGKAPRVIDEYAVVNSYPMKGQNFLLKNEFNRKGKILLYQYSKSYFTFEDATVPELKLTFVEKNTGARINSTFYADPTQHITFDIPSSLKNETVYQVYFTVEDKNHAKGLTAKIKIDDKDLRYKNGRVNLTINDATKAVSNSISIEGKTNSTTPANPIISGNISSVVPNTSTPKGTASNISVNTNNYQLVNPYANTPQTPSSPSTALDKSNIIANPKAFQDALIINKDNIVSEGDTLALLGHTTEVFQPESGRIIYSSIFRTSKYNSFKDKMASLGSEIDAAETPSKDIFNLWYYDVKDNPDKYDIATVFKATNVYDIEIPIFNTGELFDEFEIKGMKRKVGYDKSHLFDYTIPPLLKVNPNKFQTDFTLHAYAQPRLSADIHYDMPMYSISKTLIDSNFLHIVFSNPYIRGTKTDYSYNPAKEVFNTYDTPRNPYKMSNECTYFTLLNDEGTSNSAGTNSSISMSIIDQSPSIVATDFYLFKEAEKRYAKGRKELKSYYDKVDFTFFNYLVDPNYFKFKDLILKPYNKTLATYAGGSISVNVLDNKVTFEDKVKYAQSFWIGMRSHKLMESVRLLDYKVSNKYDNVIYIEYGHSQFSDLWEYNGGNNKDQNGNLKLGFDFNNYPIFPINGPSINKKVKLISSQEMREKKEAIINFGVLLDNDVKITIPSTTGNTNNSGTGATLPINHGNVSTQSNVIYNTPPPPVLWPPIVGQR
ncbi:MAG: hypothetical protein M9887_04540 [Chitinophagales bacterium]|nr:hypothetical protein [Chitinophagales bacterium]